MGFDIDWLLALNAMRAMDHDPPEFLKRINSGMIVSPTTYPSNPSPTPPKTIVNQSGSVETLGRTAAVSIAPAMAQTTPRTRRMVAGLYPPTSAELPQPPIHFSKTLGAIVAAETHSSASTARRSSEMPNGVRFVTTKIAAIVRPTHSVPTRILRFLGDEAMVRVT